MGKALSQENVSVKAKTLRMYPDASGDFLHKSMSSISWHVGLIGWRAQDRNEADRDVAARAILLEDLPATGKVPLAPNHGAYAPVQFMKDARDRIYANWTPTGDIDPATPPGIEFYDYATADGRAGTNNTPDDPRVPALLDQLLSDLLPSELRAPLPGTFGDLQNAARGRTWLLPTCWSTRLRRLI
jgi:hypothetical protein